MIHSPTTCWVHSLCTNDEWYTSVLIRFSKKSNLISWQSVHIPNSSCSVHRRRHFLRTFILTYPSHCATFSSLSRFPLIVTSSSGPQMYLIWTSPAYQACLFRNEEKQADGEDSFCQHKWKYYEQLRGLFHKQFSPVGTRPSRWLYLHH